MIKYLERLHEIGIFTLDDVCAMTGNMHSAQQLMQNYVKKGLVGSIRRGLYCVNDLSTRNQQIFSLPKDWIHPTVF